VNNKLYRVEKVLRESKLKKEEAVIFCAVF